LHENRLVEPWVHWQGVTVMDAALYFRTYWRDCAEVADLFDSLAAAAVGEDAAAGGGTEAGSRSAGFAPHLGAAALEAGLDAGTLLQVCSCNTLVQCLILQQHLTCVVTSSM
jgi:hypothetical protein